MDIVTEAIKAFVNGALGVSFREMAIQIVSTLVLFFIVRFFFWNHITDYLESRKEAMSKSYLEAEEAKTKAQSIQAEAKKELESIQNSAKEKIDEATTRGRQREHEIISKAKNNATHIVENAEVEVNRLYQQAQASMQDEIVSVATVMAEKILEKELDEKKYKALLKEATDEVAS